MSIQTLNIINKASRSHKVDCSSESRIIKNKYNIITFDTHERFQTELAKTNHNFYSFKYNNCKIWNEVFAKIPCNYYSLPTNNLLRGIDYDFILSQSKFGQLQVAKQIQSILKIPIISVEHTVPTKDLSGQQIESMKNLRGDINVFITEYARSQWGYDGEIIENSIDFNVFQPLDIQKEKYILTIANDFVKRDYCLNYKGWLRVTQGLPTKLVGDNPGLSKPARSIDELVQEYNKCYVYLNTSTESQLPTVLLEAMACGVPVVTTATCSIPSFIQHGVNGFMSNSESDLVKYLNLLLENNELREQIGKQAREMIMQRFSHEKFINNWNAIFDKAYEAK